MPTIPFNEPWVDMRAVAKHLDFSYNYTAKLVKEGQIPSKKVHSGKRIIRRFRLSAVDAAWSQSTDNSQASAE